MGNICKNDIKEEKEEKISIYKEDLPMDQIKNKSIEILKKKVMNIPLFQRKVIAKEKYNKIINEINKIGIIINKDNFIYKYFNIFELLLLNNTDKDIVSLYLNFIKENDIYVKSYNFETFDNEIKNYNLIFEIKEVENIKKGLKLLSRKDILKNFLKELSNVENDENINNIYSKAEDESKKIIYFNYPIEFSNKELYYYKIYILLILHIAEAKKHSSKKFKDNYIRNKKGVAQLILNNNVLENEKIINNEDKMNILTLLIMFDNLDEQNSSLNFNRLLQTEKTTYIELKNHILDNKLGIIKVDKMENISFRTDFDANYEVYPDNVCLKNLNKKALKLFLNRFDDYKFNTLDKLLTKNRITPYIENIKMLLIKIIDSNVLKETIKKLFPEYYIYFLNSNLKDIKECIKSRIKFYPYEQLRFSGVTDKLSCYSFISVFFETNAPFNYMPILNCGAIIDNCIFHMNHLIQNIIHFRAIDKSMFLFQKKEEKEKNEFKDIENILFGKKIQILNILECFYILNEYNYNQSLEDFRKNFENITKDNIAFSEKVKFIKCDKDDAVFKEFFNIIKNYDNTLLMDMEYYYINAKSQACELEDYFISIPKKYCKFPE